MHSVREINRLDDLDEIRLAWRALWGETREATFFHSLDWLETYWRHFGAAQKLRVFVVQSQGRPIGILPLVVRRERTAVGPLRVLTYPLDYWGSFYGPLGAQSAATLSASLTHLAHAPRDWDLVDLKWIDTSRADHGRTGTALALAGLKARREPLSTVSLVDLTTGWDAYWSSRKSRLRKNVLRSERQLLREGRLELIRYRPQGSSVGDDDPRWDLYNACVELSARSWQGQHSTQSALCHERVASFLREMHAVAVRCGAADIALLTLNGQPVAFHYSYVYRGYVSGLRSGFDPRWAPQGVGSVLMARSIADLAGRGDRIFDLGPDYADPKRPWRTAQIPADRCRHYASLSWRAQGLRLAHRLKRCWPSPPLDDDDDDDRPADPPRAVLPLQPALAVD